jgi:hypothetical protein
MDYVQRFGLVNVGEFDDFSLSKKHKCMENLEFGVCSYGNEKITKIEPMLKNERCWLGLCHLQTDVNPTSRHVTTVN